MELFYNIYEVEWYSIISVHLFWPWADYIHILCSKKLHYNLYEQLNIKTICQNCILVKSKNPKVITIHKCNHKISLSLHLSFPPLSLYICIYGTSPVIRNLQSKVSFEKISYTVYMAIFLNLRSWEGMGLTVYA